MVVVNLTSLDHVHTLSSLSGGCGKCRRCEKCGYGLRAGGSRKSRKSRKFGGESNVNVKAMSLPSDISEVVRDVLGVDQEQVFLKPRVVSLKDRYFDLRGELVGLHSMSYEMIKSRLREYARNNNVDQDEIVEDEYGDFGACGDFYIRTPNEFGIQITNHCIPVMNQTKPTYDMHIERDRNFSIKITHVGGDFTGKYIVQIIGGTDTPFFRRLGVSLAPALEKAALRGTDQFVRLPEDMQHVILLN